MRQKIIGQFGTRGRNCLWASWPFGSNLSVLSPTSSGTDARAIIVHFAAQHADTVAKITDQAVDAVAVVIADAGLRGRVDDDDALRAAIHAFVVDRFREFVVARIIETN